MLVLKDTITLKPTTGAAKQFRVLSVYPRETVSRINGQTLRGRSYSHVRYRKWKYEITFEANDVASEEAFFEAMLLENTVELTITDVGGTDYTKLCVMPDGDVAREYINGIIALPELKLTLEEVDAEIP
jgi:hypothetical protein